MGSLSVHGTYAPPVPSAASAYGVDSTTPAAKIRPSTGQPAAIDPVEVIRWSACAGAPVRRSIQRRYAPPTSSETIPSWDCSPDAVQIGTPPDGHPAAGSPSASSAIA